MLKVSIICPLLNEEESIDPLIDTLLDIKKLANKSVEKNFVFEYIFVDNASRDETVARLKSHKKKFSKDEFLIAVHSENFGIQHSILTGINLASGDSALVFQSDLQDPPHVAVEMINAWGNGAKYVSTRIINRNSSFLDSLLRTLGYYLLRLFTDSPIVLNGSDFWIIDQSIVKRIKDSNIARPFFRINLPLIQKPDLVLPYSRLARKYGRSKFNLIGKYGFFIDAVFADFVRFPRFLILFSTISLIASVPALILAVFLTGRIETIFISLLFLMSALMILSTSLMFEFINRMYSSFKISRKSYEIIS